MFIETIVTMLRVKLEKLMAQVQAYYIIKYTVIKKEHIQKMEFSIELDLIENKINITRLYPITHKILYQEKLYGVIKLWE